MELIFNFRFSTCILYWRLFLAMSQANTVKSEAFSPSSPKARRPCSDSKLSKVAFFQQWWRWSRTEMHRNAMVMDIWMAMRPQKNTLKLRETCYHTCRLTTLLHHTKSKSNNLDPHPCCKPSPRWCDWQVAATVVTSLFASSCRDKNQPPLWNATTSCQSQLCQQYRNIYVTTFGDIYASKCFQHLYIHSHVLLHRGSGSIRKAPFQTATQTICQKVGTSSGLVSVNSISAGLVMSKYMGVSKNRGIPKRMVYNGKPY